MGVVMLLLYCFIFYFYLFFLRLGFNVYYGGINYHVVLDTMIRMYFHFTAKSKSASKWLLSESWHMSEKPSDLGSIIS